MNQSIKQGDAIDTMFYCGKNGNKCKAKTKEEKIYAIYVNEMKVHLSKLKLIMKLKLVHGPFYIVLRLEILNMQKNLFVSMVETGNEVVIPKDLIMGGRPPQSFQFYDWIYSIVHSRISEKPKIKIASSQT